MIRALKSELLERFIDKFISPPTFEAYSYLAGDKADRRKSHSRNASKIDTSGTPLAAHF